MLANAPVMAMIPCVDLVVARAFYGSTLGLNEMKIPGVEESDVTIYASAQGTQLVVYKRSTPTKADHTAAGWMVDDVDEAADFLISRGVTLKTYPDMEDTEWDERGVATRGDFKTAWFTDPEGNILSIVGLP